MRERTVEKLAISLGYSNPYALGKKFWELWVLDPSIERLIFGLLLFRKSSDTNL